MWLKSAEGYIWLIISLHISIRWYIIGLLTNILYAYIHLHAIIYIAYDYCENSAQPNLTQTYIIRNNCVQTDILNAQRPLTPLLYIKRGRKLISDITLSVVDVIFGVWIKFIGIKLIRGAFSLLIPNWPIRTSYFLIYQTAYPSPTLGDLGIWTHAFEPWLTRTNDFKKIDTWRFLACRSALLG